MNQQDTLYNVIEYLLDELRDKKAEAVFFREAGNDRQRLLDKSVIDQRAEPGFKNFTPEEIVQALKAVPHNGGI